MWEIYLGHVDLNPPMSYSNSWFLVLTRFGESLLESHKDLNLGLVLLNLLMFLEPNILIYVLVIFGVSWSHGC